MKMLRKRGTAKRRRLKARGWGSRVVRYMWFLGRSERKGRRDAGAGVKGAGIED